MVKTLLKIRLRQLFHSLMKSTRRGKGKGMAMKILFALLMVYCVGVFGVLFGGMFYVLSEPFAQLNLSWLYFAFAGVMAAMLCFVGSVFFTQSVIFEAKDNELLLSMPIKPSAILFSRVGTLFLLNLAYSLIITVPCGIVWCITQGANLPGIIAYIISCLLLPLLPTALSCIFGWLIALISVRMRNKNLVMTVLSIASMAAYFYVCFNAQNLLTTLLENGVALAASIEKVLPPFHALGLALAEGQILQMLYYALWCVVPFALVYALLSHSFMHIATMKRGLKKVKYEAKKLRVSSVRRALTVKELRRLGGNSMYMLNGCTGAIMAVGFGAVLLVKNDVLNTMLSEFAELGLDLSVWMSAIACAILCLLMSMNIISAPSISVEGKNLWLMQALPVKAGDVLLAKAYAHMAVCVPAALVAGILFSVALKADVISLLALTVLPTLLSAFCALMGVTVNLHLPRLDYANETVAVKQSASSGVVMFAGMGIVALPVILYAAVFKASFAVHYLYLICAILLALGCAVLYYYLTHGAQKRFANLGQ